MELWVRSQDKRLLCKVDSLNCYKLNGSFNISTGNQLLGKYSTEERCLEIIDEIQQAIETINKVLFMTESEMTDDMAEGIYESIKNQDIGMLANAKKPKILALNKSIVYEMPEN